MNILVLLTCILAGQVSQCSGRSLASLGLETGGPVAVEVSKPKAALSWGMRGAWLLQHTTRVCDPAATRVAIRDDDDDDDCKGESMHVLLLLGCLCGAIVTVICAFAFIREDKEEQITPLCPQLVVKEPELRFKMPLDAQVDSFEVTDMTGQKLCKVALDWPDPFRPGISGVAATVRLQNILELTLATVVAPTPSLHVAGQGLALCRAGCEIFGFVEPDGDKRYHVRHRTGVHLLTLVGDFATCDIEGLNPVGSKVCEVSQSNGMCHGRVLQHVDAGLVICSLLATHVHRRLPQNNNNSDAMSSVSIPSPMPALPALTSPQEAEESPSAQAEEKPDEEQTEQTETTTTPPVTSGQAEAE